MTLNTIGRELRLVVQDNGCGLKPSHGHGLGLIAMRERAQAQGGSFAIDVPASGGTRVVVTLKVGETVAAIEHERTRFTKKWQLRCPAVIESLKEAGDELFTLLRFPRSQWRALRTTNALERINEEFRRRTKTQASLPGQDA